MNNQKAGANPTPEFDDIEVLRERLARAELELETYRRGISMFSRIAGYISAGPSLQSALEKWDIKFREGSDGVLHRIPREETLEVVAAYIRRRALAGLAIAAFAAVPGILSIVLLASQNSKIDQQIYLTQVTQAVQLQEPLAKLLTDIEQEPQNICLPKSDLIRSEAARIFQKHGIDRYLCWSDIRHWEFVETQMWQFFHATPDVRDTASSREWVDEWEKRFIAERESPLRIADSNAVRGSRLLRSRTEALANMFRPYRVLVDSEGTRAPELSGAAYSPERGLLLQAYASAHLSIWGLSFADAWAPRLVGSAMDWSGVDLSRALLECGQIGGNFTDADLSRIQAAGIQFVGADLRGLRSIVDADLSHARFYGGVLPDPSLFVGTNLQKVQFDGVLVPSATWVSDATNGRIAGNFKYTEVEVANLPEHFHPIPDFRDHTYARKFKRYWRLTGLAEGAEGIRLGHDSTLCREKRHVLFEPRGSLARK